MSSNRKGDRTARDAPWRDADLVRKLYWGDGLTATEVADGFGCTKQCVLKWMGRNGIPRRDPNNVPFSHKPMAVRSDGYVVWSGSGPTVLVHRLLAVSIFGLDAVSDNHVHHENEIPWDNRPSNIRVESEERHKRIHAQERERDERGRFL